MSQLFYPYIKVIIEFDLITIYINNEVNQVLELLLPVVITS
jgi:hypothetical protein